MLFEQFFLLGRELSPLAPQLVAQFFRPPGKALPIGFRSLPLGFPGLAVAAQAFALGFELFEFGAQPVELGRLVPARGGLRVGPGLLLGGEMGSGGIQFGLGLVQLRGPSGEIGRFLGDRLGSSLGGGCAGGLGGLAGRSGGNRFTLLVELLLRCREGRLRGGKVGGFLLPSGVDGGLLLVPGGPLGARLLGLFLEPLCPLGQFVPLLLPGAAGGFLLVVPGAASASSSSRTASS